MCFMHFYALYKLYKSASSAFRHLLLFKGLGARPGITYRLRLPDDRLNF
ncbi:hypothetical protein O77CONTIG1_02057 [Leptolyngbya sp. O-77]|nr:hypothetical protein O77CONTIG1_02057 [Leptolyngbya sp. O-77]